MVALTHKSEQVCGGSLIADDIVLSSAHCSTLINGASIGRNDLNDESEIFEIYNIETVINHPSFQGSNDFDNDFMLLKLYGWSLKKVVTLNKDPNVPANGDELTIIGYGKDNMETTTSAGKLKGTSTLIFFFSYYVFTLVHA
jgi:secreted trypsin-like serine protease